MAVMKLPTALGSAGDQLRLANAVTGELQYVTPGADSKIMALSMHGRFLVKGNAAADTIVASVAIDETQITSGNVIARVDYSYYSPTDTTGSITLDVDVYRITGTNTDDSAFAAGSIITDTITAAPTTNFMRRSDVQGTGQAAVATATYAIGVTWGGTALASDQIDLKDLSITIVAE